MQPPRKVLQLISSAGHYGAENMILHLSRNLERNGIQTTIGVFLNTHCPNTEIAEHARQAGLDVKIFHCGGKADITAVRHIRNFVRQNDYQILHTHGYKANLYGFLATRSLMFPIVSTCHNWPTKRLSLRAYAVLDHLVLRNFDQVVAVSGAVQQSLLRYGVSHSGVKIIHNGIETQRFENGSPTLRTELKANNRILIGMVGRLVAEKGPHYLLQAAPKILRCFPDTLIVFVGEGKERERLAQLASQMNISKKVMFLGRRNDMADVYASLDVLVLPSLDEGLPLTVLEALAAEKAVVATRVGALAEIITDGESGLIVNPADVVGLERALFRLLGDPQLRSRLAASGKQTIHHRFSAERMTQEYIVTYSELLRKRAVTDLDDLHCVMPEMALRDGSNADARSN